MIGKIRPLKKYQAIMDPANVVAEFVRQNNIMATWINCNQVFGYKDKELGKWNGEIGKVCMIAIDSDYLLN